MKIHLLDGKDPKGKVQKDRLQVYYLEIQYHVKTTSDLIVEINFVIT